MSTIDQQFVEYIVKSLVSNPDDVKIDRSIDEKGVLLKLEVAGEDLGRVIGKRGATAQSIRTLLRALGTKNEARYNLKIIDPEQGERPSKPREDRPASDDDKPKDEPTNDNKADEEVKTDVAEEVGEEAVEAAVETPEVVEEVKEDKQETSFADKHRADLDDLDDLDI